MIKKVDLPKTELGIINNFSFPMFFIGLVVCDRISPSDEDHWILSHWYHVEFVCVCVL